MNKDKVELIECMNTFQGEGPDSGYRMLLCRFKLCNLVDKKVPCNFCDTLIKMRIQEEFEYPIDKIQEIIDSNKCGLMITGGEPGYQKNLYYTIDMLNKLTFPIANVETNGCNLSSMLNLVNGFKKIKFVYSPKIFSENDFIQFKELAKKFHVDQRLFFKIVVPDWKYNNRVIEYLDHLDCNDRTYLMPKGKDYNEIIESSSLVLHYAEQYKVNITSRMHIMHNFI